MKLDLLPPISALALIAFLVVINEAHDNRSPQPTITGGGIPCNHGCQHKPFYRGSSRMISFYHSGDFPTNDSFRLLIEEANKEGGTIVIVDSVRLTGGVYSFTSSVVFLAETAHDVIVTDNTFNFGEDDEARSEDS